MERSSRAGLRAACYGSGVILDLEPPFLLIKPGNEEEFYRLEGEDGDWEYPT